MNSLQSNCSTGMECNFKEITVSYSILIAVCCFQLLSPVGLFCNPMDLANQTPLSMGFPRQEYLVDCHFLLQGIFLTQRLIPYHLHCQAGSLQLSQPPGKPHPLGTICNINISIFKQH